MRRSRRASDRFWRSTDAVYCLATNHQSVKEGFAVSLKWTIEDNHADRQRSTGSANQPAQCVRNTETPCFFQAT
ncbi:hypothetical protein BCEP4_2090007 [Burkholderia cepacia]|nr:hypothetical protein BCEP4_2090007 [Burkholderia cepacia]